MDYLEAKGTTSDKILNGKYICKKLLFQGKARIEIDFSKLAKLTAVFLNSDNYLYFDLVIKRNSKNNTAIKIYLDNNNIRRQSFPTGIKCGRTCI